MKSIYNYSDYRQYLVDVLEEKKQANHGFSLRAAALKLGLNSGTLTRIVNGTRELGPSLLAPFISYLGLRTREADYFTLLVKFARSSKAGDRQRYYSEIQEKRREMRRVVEEKDCQFFEKWYYGALHQLLRVMPAETNPETLGKCLTPPITTFKAKKALSFLENNGFISKKPGSGYEVKDPSLTTGEIWHDESIRSYQIAMSEMGTRAVNHFPQQERDISTLSLCLSPQAYKNIRQLLKRTRQEILALEEADNNQDRVFHVNFQLFPLSQESKKRKAKK
ncbi:MAG: TIGR02147 family protein [Fibrobacteria bacterium]|nr:TIGR02147 family protein [Fibrobacteria bacterium]